MNIQIKDITLVNFKGVRDLCMELNTPVTSIYGRNRSGKTTLADAINWCLFGKDSKGNSQFGIKTRDNDGMVIPNIEHSVSLTLNCDGIIRSLKRSLVEKYQKVRGMAEQAFVGNTTEYLIDGNAATATDYKKFISELIDEETFKAITTPSYFTSLTWQQQRLFLSEMVGNISNERVAGGEKRFGELLGILQQESIEEHLKHLSYQIRQLKVKLDDIPVRIAEQNKALPEQQDWDAIEKQITIKESELEKVQSELAKAKYNGGEDLKKKSIREKIAFNQKRIDNMVKSARYMADESYEEYSNKSRKLAMETQEKESSINVLTDKINAHKQLAERVRESLESCEKRVILIREQWADNKAKRFSFDESQSVCQMCGQPLPPDLLKDKIHEYKQRFNERKQEKFDELTAMAEQVKKTKQEATDSLNEYNSVINQSIAQRIKFEKELEELKKQEVEKPKTYQELLGEKQDYTKLIEENGRLEDELENVHVEDNSMMIAEVETRMESIKSEVDLLKSTLSEKRQYERICDLISEIEKEKKNIVNQLSLLEEKEDTAREFQERAGNLLEEEVNSHFSYVKFTMFKEFNNGNKEPYCECSHDGIPYSDLNSADKINCGLDIINTLCKVYEVTAPIVIDNAESVNKLLSTDGQQIRLYVSEDNTLTIK